VKKLSLIILVVAFLFSIEGATMPRSSPPAEAVGSATLLAAANYDIELPDAVVGTPPANSDFSQSSYETGSPPTNNGFGTEPNCNLNDWQVGGTVTAQSGGANGCYARTETGATLTSSEFSVPTDVQTLTFQIALLDGYNNFQLKVIYDGSPTTIISLGSASGEWATQSVNFSDWAGKDIQIQFYTSGSFGLDDLGMMHVILPQWQTPAGVPELGSGGPGGTFAKVGAQGSTLTSPAFTVDASAQNVTWSEKYFGGTNNYCVYVLVWNEGTQQWEQDTTKLILNAQAPADWGQRTRNITNWQGKLIKLKFYTNGTLGFDDVGIQHVVIQGWDTPGVPNYVVQLASGGPWDQYADMGNGHKITYSPLSMPSNAQNLTVEWKPIGGSYNFIMLTMKDASTGQTCRSTTYAMVRGAGDWRKASFSVGSCPGKNVRIEIGSVGEIGVDNIAISLAEMPRRGSNNTPDPVDTSSGTFTHQHTDLAIPGRGVPLEFTRYYSSHSSHSGSLGRKWTHTYETRLDIAASGDVTVRYPQGSSVYFAKSGSSYTPPTGVFDTLVKNGNGTYTLTTTAQIRYNYSAAGKLTSIVDRNDNATTVDYDGNGFLASVTDPGDRSLTFTTDASGRITEIADPLDRTVEFAYDGAGDLVTVTDVKGGESSFTYSGHRMLTITDSLGHVQTTNVYDSASRVVEQTDAVDGVTCIYYGTPVGIYDPSYDCPTPDPEPDTGQTIVVDPRGNATTYDFDINFRTVKITDALDGVVEYGYDANGNRNSVEDQNNHTTTFTYDAKGNVLSRTDALDNEWTFTYNANNDPTLETDPLGRQVEYQYDAAGNLTKIRHLDEYSAEISHIDLGRDAGGNGDLTSITDARENTTTFEYDSYGNQTGATDPLDGEASSTYDLGGRQTSVTDELDHTTTYTHDAQNNVLTVTDELDNTTTLTYDAKGNLETVTDANDNLTERVYDDADRLIEVVDALENSVSYTYDANGNRTSATDARDKTTTYAYDDLNRLVSVTDPLSHVTTYDYDAAGNQTESTDAEGLLTKQFYSDINQLTGVEHWDGLTLMDSADYAYDDVGNRTSVTNARGKTTTYAYDNLNRLWTVTDPLGSVTEYGYDANGNRIWLKDANHESRDTRTDYTYDEMNRLTNIQYPDVHYYVEYEYDAAGRRTSMTDVTLSPPSTYNENITTYDYDDVNRLTSVTWPGDLTVAYEYDDVGNRTSITYPDDRVVDYTYDDLNRLDTATDWADPANATSYGYDDAGNLLTTTYPSSTEIVSTRTYDDAGRLLSLVNEQDGTPVSSYAYTLDDVGNRTQMTDSSGDTDYVYDALYRLTNVTYPDESSTDYTYDDAGNRLTLDDGQDELDYTYDDADQLTQIDEGPTYYYDANGNWRSIGADTAATWWAIYDYDNRPVRSGPCHDVDGDGDVDEDDEEIVEDHSTAMGDADEGDSLYDYHYDINQDGVIDEDDVDLVADQAQSTPFCPTTANIDYNGDGLRVQTKVRPVEQDPVRVTSYVWDTAAYLPVIIQETKNETTSSYLYGLDLVSVADNSGVQTYFLQDGLGSTTGLTDEDGDVTDTYSYDVFGAVKSHAGTSANPYRFTGELQDTQAARQPMYLRARYYDPALGRFLSRDSLPGSDTVPQTKNRYAYAYNNPANIVDPLGLCGLNGAGDVADCAAKIAEGFAYAINKLEMAIGQCAELGPSKCPAELVDSLHEALWETIEDAAEWMGEDYHWATVGAAVAGGAFIGGWAVWAAGGSPYVAAALIGGGFSLDTAFTVVSVTQSSKRCAGGDRGACVSAAVGTAAYGFGFVPGATGIAATVAPVVTDVLTSEVDALLTGTGGSREGKE